MSHTDLDIAKQEIGDFRFEVSRVSIALHSIARVLTDEDNPPEPSVTDGLGEAITILGQYLEYYADDRNEMLESIARERSTATQRGKGVSHET